MNKKRVTIFYKNGATSRFEQVTDLKCSDMWTTVSFHYISAADGLKSFANFSKQEIAGWSIGG